MLKFFGLKLLGLNALLNPMYFIRGWPFFFKEEIINILILEGLVIFLSFFINIFAYVSFPSFTIIFILFRRVMAGGICTSDKRLDGQVVIVTGSNTGIGKQTARDLGKRGAEIIMACRNTSKAQSAANEIRSESGCKVSIYKLDLCSLTSVRKFAEDIKAKHSTIHCLINNAGVMACPYATTEDKFEMQFGVNHLGHFLLTHLLLPLLRRAPSGRIITLSSMAHMGSPKNPFDDLSYKNGYDTLDAYAISKLANILFTRHLAKELKDSNIQVFSVHPGVVQSELGRHLPLGIGFVYQYLISLFVKTTAEGAQTSIYCATDAVEKSPHFFSDCSNTTPTRLAMSDKLAGQLWSLSEGFISLKSK